jgi:Na+-driven multidrug efflux pump
MNRPDLVLKIGIVICITNITLNYLIIPKWGILTPLGINGPTGAAIATVTSSLVGFIAFGIIVKRMIGVKFLDSKIYYHIIAGVLMGSVLYLINYVTSLSIRWYHLLLFAGLGLAIYLGILYVLKEFTKKDLKFFLNMIHPKEMLSYISSELKDKGPGDKK